MNPLLLLAPRLATNRLWARAGAVPSFHINPLVTGHARDLITGTVLGGGTVNSATPAWEVGPGGILAQPAANAPVVAYDPVTLRPLGLRVWQGVTNLFSYSQDFDDPSWGKTNSTISPNAATAPDGTTTADKHIPDNGVAMGTSGLQTRLFKAFTPAVGQEYTASVFAKGAGFDQIEIACQASTVTATAVFSLSSGVVVSSGGGAVARIIQHPNGWYSCSIRFTATVGTATAVRYSAKSSVVSTGNGTDGVFVWGAQPNTGPLAPYVPTTTTTASSTADATDITSLPGGINNIRTIYARVRTPASGIRGIISLNDNSSSNRLELLTNGTDPRAVAVTSGSTVADINGGAIAANTTFRIAARFDGDNYAVSINGAPVVTDNAGAKAIVDRIFLGRTQAGEYLNGIIEELATWTQPLGNSQLQAVAA